MTAIFLLNFAIFLLNTDTNVVFASNSSSVTQSITPSMTPSVTPSMTSSVTPSNASSISQQTNTISPSPTSAIAQPSSTVIEAAQVNVGDSSGKIDVANLPLPPLDQRRDFDLIAHTKLKWIAYLLDQTGAEFIFMSKLIEKTFNDLLKSVPGFIKTKLVEFKEEQVTFNLIIYTKKESQVQTTQLQQIVKAYTSTGEDVLKIYEYEIKPRFRALPPDSRIKPAYTAGPSTPEEVNLFQDFLKGFGVAMGMAGVFTIIGVIKYKMSKALNSKDKGDDTEALKSAYDNDAMECMVDEKNDHF